MEQSRTRLDFFNIVFKLQFLVGKGRKVGQIWSRVAGLLGERRKESVDGLLEFSGSPQQRYVRLRLREFSLIIFKLALQNGIPISDPTFYSSETLCPDSLIESIFTPAEQCSETMPLLQQRIAIMREVGFILSTVGFVPESTRVLRDSIRPSFVQAFRGSYQGLLAEFQHGHNGQGTALDLVKFIIGTFPSFRDEVYLEGTKG